MRSKYELPLTSVGNPRDYLVNRWGTPAFCWVAGDGNTPTVGPALTATGTPGTIAGPWELEDGTRLPLETMDGAVKRETASWSIADGHDMVAAVAWLCDASASYAISTRPAGLVGFDMFVSSGVMYSRFCGGGAAGTVQSSAAIPGAGGKGLVIQTMVVDRSDAVAGVKQYINGALNGSAGCPAGASNPGALALLAQSGAAGAGYRGCLFAAIWQGASVADAWTAARVLELQALATGIEPRGNQAALKGRPTFARASAATWYDQDSRLWIASSGLARAGDPVGSRMAPARANKCYNNINPQATTGWTATGGTHTAAADAAALATAKLECAGPNVHKFVPGASDQVLYGGAATAGTSAHSLSCYLRGDAGGEEVVIGLRDASAGTVQACATVTLTTAYVRYTADNVTPADSDQVFALDCDAGDTVYAVFQQLEAGEDSTSPIPNWATAATAARAATTLDPPVTPKNTRGKVRCGVTPLGYSGAVTGGNTIVARTTGGTVLGTDDSTDDWTTNDGSTEVKAGAVATGVRAAIVVEWAGTTQQLTVDAAIASAAYDGAVAGSGTYRLQASAAEVAIDSLIIEDAT